ncbi:hypothetical protein BT63DRAFT_361496, partial [Microthyrium microscopicum]
SACNNSPHLCSRSYGNITHLGAHDSPFVSNEANKFNIGGNQFWNSTIQLDAGVRLLSGQVHPSPSEGPSVLRVCHTSCAIYDGGLLTDWLASISRWLDRNANEVVTLLLVNGGGIEATILDSAYKNSGIAKYTFTPSFTSAPVLSSWPDLNSFVSSNKRLITFVDSLPSGNTGASYLLPEFSYIFENAYEITSPTGFTCAPARPPTISTTAQAQSSNMMFLQNHFLGTALGAGIVIPNMNASSNTNGPDANVTGSLGAAAKECQMIYNKAPNFLLVDWFDHG